MFPRNKYYSKAETYIAFCWRPRVEEKSIVRCGGFSAWKLAGSRIALRHSPLFQRGIRSMCYVIGSAGGAAAKGRNTLSSSNESLIRIYQKDWLLHCGPRSASVLLAIAIRTCTLATNINVPLDAAARSQCASQSL